MKSLDLAKFSEEVHQVAKDHGWWEKGHKSPLECMALMVSEIAEAMEEVRKPENRCYIYQLQEGTDFPIVTPASDRWRADLKPEGEAVELADCILRILDYAEFHKLPLMEALQLKHEFNKTRPHKHGKLK